jgi:hypothetical protein
MRRRTTFGWWHGVGRGVSDEPIGPLWALPLQQFVYRQFMYLVVIQSIISALRGTRLRWQHLERTGDIEIANKP